jgi:hypothetical protein
MVAAHLAHTGRPDRIAALTLLVTVLDQARAGLGSAVIDERSARPAVQVAAAASAARGYVDGRSLAEVFAWLRPNDLIWNYWVNNYLLGRKPPAFDILSWNADTTRMTAGLHRDFLQLGVSNALARPGAAAMLGSPVDLSAIDRDSYLVAGITDHIWPLAELLPLHRPAGREHAVRPVHQRAHRRHGEPARPRQGQLPGGRGQPAGPGRVAAPRGDPPRLLVARPRGLAGRALRRGASRPGRARRRRPGADLRRPGNLRP